MAGGVESAKRREQGFELVLLASQRGEHRCVVLEVDERLLDGRSENRMRAELDENRVTFLGELRDRGREKDGRAQIPRPVGGAELDAVQATGADRRVEGMLGMTRRDRLESSDELVQNRIHLGAVG